ncbi:NlpC/P60 family protein [Halomonas binhaiensis]|uniref:C40 family peptidase n=1 Tax=Halomonas binhaiensis TaxID=2562282 RepID=A0A5C1NEK3_9GAMM|nr:NlpC/P60 family protein [Halomonas binhaiensis]QEM81103.1 C40 family peptidase [Halomonas binhaiensis]
MSVALSCRAAAALVLLGLLAGCASSSQKDVASQDYYSQDLPGMAAQTPPLMSPAGGSLTANVGDELVRETLMEEHGKWAGTPYRLGGTSFSGIDCSALVQNIFNEAFQVDLPRTTGSQINTGIPIGRTELSPGDLVFFRPPGSRHVGIYVGDGRFLHASSSRGVMISKLSNSYWSRYYWQARRPLQSTDLASLQLSSSGYGFGS